MFDPHDHLSQRLGRASTRTPLGSAEGNGHKPFDGATTEGPESAESPARRRRGPGPTVWPATIVLGIALVVVVTGAVAAVLTTGPVTTGSTAPKVAQAAGAPVPAVAAQDALAPIITAGSPPANVVDAVVTPAGATVVPGSATNLGVGLYDRSIGFSTSLSEAVVIDFYRVELPAEGWEVMSQGPPRNASGFELLGRIAGTDGYFWEIGVVVSPTTYPKGSAAGANGATAFTLRLFAVDDTT
ncbi:MAG TPA: hypothetical protein VED63_09310 [Acidimicrobiales bacterium]|nr:hypothetical protein [Acidimicrobiales bacterium]